MKKKDLHKELKKLKKNEDIICGNCSHNQLAVFKDYIEQIYYTSVTEGVENFRKAVMDILEYRTCKNCLHWGWEKERDKDVTLCAERGSYTPRTFTCPHFKEVTKCQK